MNKSLQDAAKPFYTPVGNNSWQHVQQVYDHASKIVKKLEKRNLNDMEEAAILFHDSSVLGRGDKDKHGMWGGRIAAKKLKELGWDAKKIKEVKRAIEQHDSFNDSFGKFDSHTGEVLASGDANPPDIGWMLNKSYVWGIRKKLEHRDRLKNSIKSMPDKYGTSGTFYQSAPKPYLEYHKDKILKVQAALDSIRNNQKLAEKLIMNYRKKHGLVGDDIRLPDPVY